MKINYQNIYNKFIKKYHIFGIESDFHNCSNIAGLLVPEWMQGQTIYEIYVRAFSKEGTFKVVQKNLEKIKSLGINVIWFMPIYPIGKIKRKGSLGCPYSVQDYFNVNPEYGSNEDFKNLVNAAHNLDMRVIIDLVVNHVAHDYVGFEKNPELALYDKNGTTTRKVADWSDVIDLDYNNKDTWNHVLEIMQYWIREFNIDGYRCDVAGMVPTEFWEWALPQIQSFKKHFFMLAEWESPILHKKAFHATYDWILYSIMLDIVKGKATASDIADWIETKKYAYPNNSLFLRFLENHDKIRASKLFSNDQIAALLVLIFSLDGIPLIYNGQEIGSKHYPSLFEKDPIDWDKKDLEIEELIKTLIILRKKYIALSSKNYQIINHGEKNLLIIIKNSADFNLLILLNLNDKKIIISDLKYLHELTNSHVLSNTHNDYNGDYLEAYQGLIIKLN